MIEESIGASQEPSPQIGRNGRIFLAGSVYVALWMATFSSASLFDFFGFDMASPWSPSVGLRFFLLLAFGWAGALLELFVVVAHGVLPRLLDAGGGSFRFWDLPQVFSLLACAAVVLPLRRWAPEIRSFTNFRYSALFYAAALAVSALTALLGLFRVAVDPAVLAQGPAFFLSWLIGDFIAIVTFTPLLLVWALPRLERYLRQGRWRERRDGSANRPARPYSGYLIDGLLLGAALLGWFGVSWGFELGQDFPFTPLFLLLPLAGVALRGGLRGAVLGTAVMEGGLVLLVVLRGDPDLALHYQVIMVTIALTGLLLGGVVEARNQALERLRGYNETLQRELVAAEQHLQVLLRVAPVGILEFDADERCCYISTIGCALSGCTPEQAMGRNVLEFVHPNDRDYFGFVWQLNRHSQETHWLEFRLNDTDLWCAAHWINRRGADRLEGAILVLANATERREKDQRLWLLAHCDALTGLPNRSLYWDRLDQALRHARRTARSVAVLWIDLDGFKAVNDGRGHAAGDALLRAAAQRLSRRMRDSDTVARVGGDEFALILPDIADAAAAVGVAAELADGLAKPFNLPQGAARISASIGVALYPRHAADAETLVQHADMAMYAAKRAGKNQVRVWPVEAMSELETAAAADRAEALDRPPAARESLETEENTLFDNTLFDVFAPSEDVPQGDARR